MLVAVVRLIIHSSQVDTAMSSINVCQGADLMFVVLVLMMFPTICGSILKQSYVTGHVEYNATIQSMHQA